MTSVSIIDGNGNPATVQLTVPGVQGTPSTDFLSIQGGPTMTPVLTIETLALIDNAAFVDGTSKVFMSGFILDEVAGTALTENDSAAARIDSKRAQVLVLEDATTRGRRATVSAAGGLLVDLNTGTNTIGAVTLKNGSNTAGVDSSGNVSVISPVVSTFHTEQKAVGITQVGFTASALTQGATVTASSANTVVIYVGVTGVATGTGFELAPGASIFLPVNNASLIFAISGSASQKATLIGY